MVDFAAIQRANDMRIESEQIALALQNLDHGGRIVQMAIAGAPDDATITASVATGYIDYPQQMVTAIKTALEARQNDINRELSDMGFTGGPDARAHRTTAASAPRRR